MERRRAGRHRDLRRAGGTAGPGRPHVHSDFDGLAARPRPLIRYCVDWSEQRHHLAGSLGAALAARMLDLGWVSRARRGRAVYVTRAGSKGLAQTFGLEVEATR